MSISGIPLASGEDDGRFAAGMKCHTCESSGRAAARGHLFTPGYALSRRPAFSRYTEHGLIEIDDNTGERCLRAPAIGRKNWLFAGSADGGRALATWMSIIQSARLNEIEPWAYVRDILTRLAEQQDGRPVDLAELLPEAWIDSHPEYRLPLSR
mgnify:CR=1 FL=1